MKRGRPAIRTVQTARPARGCTSNANTGIASHTATAAHRTGRTHGSGAPSGGDPSRPRTRFAGASLTVGTAMTVASPGAPEPPSPALPDRGEETATTVAYSGAHRADCFPPALYHRSSSLLDGV